MQLPLNGLFFWSVSFPSRRIRSVHAASDKTRASSAPFTLFICLARLLFPFVVGASFYKPSSKTFILPLIISLHWALLSNETLTSSFCDRPTCSFVPHTHTTGFWEETEGERPWTKSRTVCASVITSHFDRHCFFTTNKRSCSGEMADGAINRSLFISSCAGFVVPNGAVGLWGSLQKVISRDMS